MDKIAAASIPSQTLWLAAAAAFFSAAAEAGDWPQFLGQTRDGHADRTPLRERLAGELPALWRRPAGAGFAGPAVADGVVALFHFDREREEEVLSALKATTGQEVWRIGYPCRYAGGMFRERGPRATPAFAGKAIVTFGSDGVLQCVEASGKLRWRRKLHEEYEVPDSYFGVACSPLVHDGLALVNLGGKPRAGLAAFRLADGGTAWTATDDGASCSSPTLANIDGKATALFLARTGLHGVDPASGAERFFQRFRSRMDASVNASTPLAAGNQAFVSACYGTGAALLDCTGGTPRPAWKLDDGLDCHFNTPIRLGEQLYAIAGRQEARPSLQCADWATGKIRWTQEGYGCAAITAADGKLWLLRDDGMLEIVEATPAAFRSRGRAKLFDAKPCRAHPAFANGVLYARSPDELIAVPLGR